MVNVFRERGSIHQTTFNIEPLINLLFTYMVDETYVLCLIKCEHILLEFLPSVAHGVEFLLDINAGVVAALQQLLTEQLECLERAGASVHLRTVLLYHSHYVLGLDMWFYRTKLV